MKKTDIPKVDLLIIGSRNVNNNVVLYYKHCKGCIFFSREGNECSSCLRSNPTIPSSLDNYTKNLYLKLNIPIYRAKKIDSDEYIEGYYQKYVYRPQFEKRTEISYHVVEETSIIHRSNEIDPLTLSIHFPDMLDSEGNKIFASLSEDGRGGDTIVNVEADLFVYLYQNGKIRLHNKFIGGDDLIDVKHAFKVTGIQE